MTADEAIGLARVHIEKQFPKVCSKCAHRFETLADYLRQTTHVGEPVSYDQQMGDFTPREPAGTLSLATCRCGTTLAISTHGMSLVTLWRLMNWARQETKRRGITWGQLLAWVRNEIDTQVLAEAARRDR